MLIFLKLIRESYLFAIQAIIVNKLRTFLSLLGITIGIFAVISVFTIVDSMEITIRKNIESLGNNVLFIQKWPWAFGGDYPWWKYLNRPVPSNAEMNEIVKRSNGIASATFMLSTNKTVKYMNRSLDNAQVLCVSNDYNKVWNVDVNYGRYFSDGESLSGKNVAIIGANVSEYLYEGNDPLGKKLKIFGRNLEVIGVLKKKGKDLFGSGEDDQIIVPINFAKNVLDTRFEGYDPTIIVKAKPMYSNKQVKDELTGIMRSVRRLKPAAEENFAINETDILTKGFEKLFDILSIAGWVIGGFSLLVGGFGIANIMFVSVRERTPILGIQKSLGAKNYFILFQILFEAVILCIIGGVFGLGLVYLISLLASGAFDMELTLTAGNIFLGVFVSVTIGLIAGIIPAYVASKLDPVEAIRVGS
jgi:putative ABC transport system permease protein